MTIDAQRIKDMFEQWDLATLNDLYAEDFEQTEMDDATPPNAPRKRTKQDLVEIFERNQVGSNVRLRVSNLFATEDNVAYTLTCLSPSGRKIVSNSILDIRDDQVVRDVAVQARDPE